MRSYSHQFLVLTAAAFALVTPLAVAAPAAAADVDRIGGADRYETAVLISQRIVGPNERAPIAFIASGTDFPDALAGAAAAAHLGGPVLLSRPDRLPDIVAAELARIDPDQVVVLGGEAALSAQVAAAVVASVGQPVTRLAGADRYETAARVAEFAFQTGVPVAFLASGASFPDALAGAAAGGSLGGPVLLTKPAGVPAATISRISALDPEMVVILGGEAVVGPGIERELERNSFRIGGVDRYATAAGVANYLRHRGGEAHLASGLAFPDALAGAALAGINDAPVLLVRPNAVPDVVELQLRIQQPARITVLGGERAVSQGVADRAAAVSPLPVDRLSPSSVAQAGVEAAQVSDVDRVAQLASSRAVAEEMVYWFEYYSIAGPYSVSSCESHGAGQYSCDVVSASFLYCGVGSVGLTTAPSGGGFVINSYNPLLGCD